MAANLSLFNASWYLQQNPDVAAAVQKGLITAELHFENQGKFEGRAPGPLFNQASYLAENPDVAKAVADGVISAYDHFLLYGAGESRSPVRMFDEAFYLAQNPDVAIAVEAGLTTAVQHFLMYGQGEPRAINPAIDLGAYLAANPDVLDAASKGLVSPLEHLMLQGPAEGRDLGNGINLGLFTQDPAFQIALESGNIDVALSRVNEVAPFIPTFEPPANWTPPVNLPIPTDFVPPEGVKLVIPEGVQIPEGTELPDTFVPPTPPVEPPVEPPAPSFTEGYGPLSPQALYNEGQSLYAGKGNPANDFSIATNLTAGIQLALDARYEGSGLDITPVDSSGDRYVMYARDGSKPGESAIRFAYSAATTAPTVRLDTFDLRLSIDAAPTSSTNFMVFQLVEQSGSDEHTYNNVNSIYDWYRVSAETLPPTENIRDDGGTLSGTVTQNIQAFQWHTEDGTHQPRAGDSYQVKLEAFAKGSGTVLAAREITIDVLPGLTYGNLQANSSSPDLIGGDGTNPATGFVRSVVKDLELGLDVRYSGSASEVAPISGTNVFRATGKLEDLRFAYSVADTSSEASGLISSYDIRLEIDIDSSVETDFVSYKLSASDNSYTWMPDGGTGHPWNGGSITDDGQADDGSSTQNIQALHWFTAGSAGAIDDEGIHHVRLAAYEAGVLVGQTEIVIIGPDAQFQGGHLTSPVAAG